jgi:phage terminase large subunit-like protein
MPTGEKSKETWANREKMVAHCWKPGQSGNPKGKPKKGNSLKDLFEGYGDKIIRGTDNITHKQALVQKMWNMALRGDAIMAKYVYDRIEGPIKNINENINRNIELAENEMLQFVKADLLRTKQFVHPWYNPAFFHREIADALQNPAIKRLIVTLPPQFGKTELLCRTFPAYYLASNPASHTIVASYNQEYVNSLSVKCRDFFQEEKFQLLFGGLELHPEQQTKHEWMLKNHQGGIIFAGIGGTITGNPADLLLIDDVTKDFEDASSKVSQDTIWNWFNSVVGTRLKGDESRIIIIMTRWMKNDLIGKILRQEEENEILPEDKFKILHYPAILNVENDEFSKGKSLWPEVKSLKFLLERQKKDPSIFKTMWQGYPRDLEGFLIKPEWIKIEDDIKSLGEKIFSCRGWDFGYTESGDFTAGARIDLYENGEQITPILAEVVTCRKDPTAVKEFIIETTLKDGPDVIVALEGGGTQIAMSSDLCKRKELLNYQIKVYTPKGDKIARAMPWILKIEDGHLRFAKGTWNKLVSDSLIEFGEGCTHDDIEDAITNAWKVLFGEGTL